MSEQENAEQDQAEEVLDTEAGDEQTVDSAADEVKSDDKPRTYTQDELDKTVRARVDKQRKKHEAEIEKLSASQSDAMARAEAAEARVAELEAEVTRAGIVARVAKDKGVSAELLAKMIGDTEEEIEANAEIISASSVKKSYPDVKDKGGSSGTGALTKEAILAIENPNERIDAIAANPHLFK